MLSNNNSIKVGDIINGKVVKNVVSFSDTDVYEALNKLKSQNLIDIPQEKLKEISNLISERGYWGANKIVQFWDEVVDLYLSGIVMDILKTASVDALSLVLQYIPYVGTYLNSWLIRTAANSIFSQYVDTSNGVIIYYATYWGDILYQGGYTGKKGYIKYYSHWRRQ